MPIDYYPAADRVTQRFDDNYPGARITPNVVVLHSTEGTSWPDYAGGATAPGLTLHPFAKVPWRQHFPFGQSSRALKNLPGGVETNTLNALQVELIGTCDPSTKARWVRSGLKQDKDFIYWPEAPVWALQKVAGLLAWLNVESGWPIPLTALDEKRWVAYPASYGKTPTRMTGEEWRKFTGVCAHQHVPENDHGDVKLPIGWLMGLAQDRAAVLRGVKPVKPAKPRTRGVRVDNAIAVLERARDSAKTDTARKTALIRAVRAARRVPFA